MRLKIFEAISASALTAFVLYVVVVRGPGRPEETTDFSTAGLGEVLFTEYLVQFELVGVLLTVAMVGAVFVAMKGEEW